MTTTVSSEAGRSFGYAAVAGVLVGTLVFVYGLLVTSASPLGGLWIAAIGLSILLAALFTTEWSGRRFGISAARRNGLSWAFTGLAAVLLVSFVAINFVEFGSGFEVSSGSESSN